MFRKFWWLVTAILLTSGGTLLAFYKGVIERDATWGTACFLVALGIVATLACLYMEMASLQILKDRVERLEGRIK